VTIATAVGAWAVEAALRLRPALVQRVLLHPAAPAEEVALVAGAAAAANVPLVRTAGRIEALRRHRDAWSLLEFTPASDALAGDADHLVLLRPAQAGNVGASWRSAFGFGVHDVALIDSRVDPWSAHALRASIGARFGLRCATFPTWSAYRSAFPEHAVIAFTARSERAIPPWALEAAPRAAWTFGPEGGAWPEGVTEGATLTTIPQAEALESYNLAVAVGIGLYARATARVR
jgi:RNA methyltransferase, TrmH family